MAGPADEEMTTTEKVVGYIHRSQEGCTPLYGGWRGGGPHWEALVLEAEAKGRLWARAIIVVSVGRDR